MESKVLLDNILARHSKYKPATKYCQKELEKEFQKLANELNISKEEVRTIWVSQFRFINTIISNCNKIGTEGFDINMYKSIRLPYMGRFEIKPAIKRKYNNENND